MRSPSIEVAGAAPRLDKMIQAALDHCGAALSQPGFKRIEAALPAHALTPAFWFDLLAGYPRDRERVERLKLLKSGAAIAADEGYSLERYAILQSLLHAAPHWPAQSLPNSVIRQCAAVCEELAKNEPQWAMMLNVDADPERFEDLAKFATLRRFIAGDVAYDHERVSPSRGLLSVPPLALPSYLAQIALVMRGVQPVVFPHLNYGRKGSLILSRENFERALWRVAKAVEMQPKLKGLNTASWFYSEVTGEIVPHMAWMRDLFVEGGAYLIDMHPHPADRYSFAHNNKKRQKLYEAGKFCPRYTAIYWQRDAFLAWAAGRPDLADPEDAPIAAPRRLGMFKVDSPKSAPQTKRNSPVTLWNGLALADKVGLVRYASITLISPAVFAAAACTVADRVFLAPVAFALAFWASQTFQYYLSQ